MQNTGKVAVLGDADFVMPFSALGLDTFAVGPGAGEAIESAGRILDGKYALVVVAENTAPLVEEVFSAQQNIPTPSIIVVPFTTESEGFATRVLGEVLRMATGINIIQND
jgi:vacuolar-type H+-ATPase subunit F/Vma7